QLLFPLTSLFRSTVNVINQLTFYIDVEAIRQVVQRLQRESMSILIRVIPLVEVIRRHQSCLAQAVRTQNTEQIATKVATHSLVLCCQSQVTQAMGQTEAENLFPLHVNSVNVNLEFIGDFFSN